MTFVGYLCSVRWNFKVQAFRHFLPMSSCPPSHQTIGSTVLLDCVQETFTENFYRILLKKTFVIYKWGIREISKNHNDLLDKYICYSPALVNFDTSKSWIFEFGCENIYSSGSETSLFLISLFPTPLVATFNQKRIKTDGLVRKLPYVDGLRQAATKGSITPICREIGEFVSLHVRLWNL